MEIIMNKILIATTLALLASAPLAFAAQSTTPPPASALTMEHCTSVERTFDSNRSHYKTEAAFQIAEQKAMSLCKWDKHRDGNIEFGSKTATKG
jgi:hypothetical protein